MAVHVLALDFGASNGRAVVGAFDGRKLRLTEVHRFPNGPVSIHQHLYWDLMYLYKQLLIGLKAAERYRVRAVGIDSWSQDFGILDRHGQVIGWPHHYRDPRTRNAPDLIRSRISEARLFDVTGKTLSPVSTLAQLAAMKESGSTALEHGRTLLFMPNLLAYFLTGEMNCDVTLASASMLYDLAERRWSREIMEAIGLPDLLPAVGEFGRVIGPVRDGIGAAAGVPVISVAQHDTLSAVLAVEAKQRPNSAFICSGTWSIVGTKADGDVLRAPGLRGKFSLEPGFAPQELYVVRYMTGLWILQECLRERLREGEAPDYERLQAEAAHSRFASVVDIGLPAFAEPGGMTDKVIAACRRSGQRPPETLGELYKCIADSLALQYAQTVEELAEATGRPIHELHIVGGGSKDRYLCEATARAAGRKVVAGPHEASVVGNILAQLMALGEIRHLDEAAALMAESFPDEASARDSDPQGGKRP
jgi:sugar (pentulose or hexulose) kinase